MSEDIFLEELDDDLDLSNLDETVQVRLTRTMKLAMQATARRHHTSVGQMLRQLVAEKLPEMYPAYQTYYERAVKRQTAAAADGQP